MKRNTTVCDASEAETSSNEAMLNLVHTVTAIPKVSENKTIKSKEKLKTLGYFAETETMIKELTLTMLGHYLYHPLHVSPRPFTIAKKIARFSHCLSLARLHPLFTHIIDTAPTAHACTRSHHSFVHAPMCSCMRHQPCICNPSIFISSIITLTYI